MTTTPTETEGGMTTAPKRIQLSRAKGWRMPPNTVKVDRSTRWNWPPRRLIFWRGWNDPRPRPEPR